jgi:hypothetical protein
MALPLGVEVCGLEEMLDAELLEVVVAEFVVVRVVVLRVVFVVAVEDDESGSVESRTRRFFVPSFSRDGEKPDGSVNEVGFWAQ